MKTEILEELVKGNWGSNLRRFVLSRVIKFITVCLMLIFLFWLVLLEDYTSLFFLLGAISGFLIFVVLHSVDNRFGQKYLKKGTEVNPGQSELPDLEEIRRKTTAQK